MRRALSASGHEVSLGRFTRLGLLTVLPGLALTVVALWAALHVPGG